MIDNKDIKKSFVINKKNLPLLQILNRKDMEPTKEDQILNIIRAKSKLKQRVFTNTFQSFVLLKEVLREMEKSYNTALAGEFSDPTFAYKELSDFQIQLKVAGDVLIFQMHSNVFEFDRDHEVWKVAYVKDNPMSTYSGVINIYNFLADSFKYERVEDIGYLVGRLFINKDKQYFVEGKRQMALLRTNFGHQELDKAGLIDIVETAVSYSLSFDLLVPPYDNEMSISVEQITLAQSRGQLKTGKRLGFGFRSDDVSGIEVKYTGG